MQTIIINSYVDIPERSHKLSNSYYAYTSSDSMWDWLKCHYHNCLRAQQELGMSTVMTSNVIVICHTINDIDCVPRINIDMDDIFHFNGYIRNGRERGRAFDFKNFYGKLPAIMKLCSVYKNTCTYGNLELGAPDIHADTNDIYLATIEIINLTRVTGIKHKCINVVEL